MYPIRGARNTAWITGSIIDDTTIKQLYNMLSSPAITGRVVIMPDTHAGAGSVIGFTAPVGDKIIPNIVGVDIGCGVEVFKISLNNTPLEKVEKIIRQAIPMGFNVREVPIRNFPDFQALADKVGYDRYAHAIGTLGGGNHFIELGVYMDSYFLIIHSGSRQLGLRTARFHQARAGKGDLAYLEGDAAAEYLEDVKICTAYARLNRQVMAIEISHALGTRLIPGFHIMSVHNYVGSDGYIRKGAIAARKGERVVIPLNRTAGTLIGTGLGNSEWNYSAPHGAGRIMSRGEAKRSISQADADAMMGNIVSSVNPVDECDAVYKPPEVIMEEIAETVRAEFVIKPVLNIKGGQE